MFWNDGEEVAGAIVERWRRAAVVRQRLARPGDAAAKAIHIAEHMHRLGDDGVSIGVHARKIFRRCLTIQPARILNLNTVAELVESRRARGLVVAVQHCVHQQLAHGFGRIIEDRLLSQLRHNHRLMREAAFRMGWSGTFAARMERSQGIFAGLPVLK